MAADSHFRNRVSIRWRLAVVIALFVLVLTGCGEKKPNVYRVGILCGSDAFVRIVDGFKKKMTELGYIEGQNIVFDVHKVNANPAADQRIAKKFVEDKVDLIFAFPTNPAVESKAAALETGIPVLFANAGIEGNNLVESIRQPGGNITGVRFPGPEQTFKRFEYLLELVPNAKKIYITWDINYPAISLTLEGLRSAAK